MRPALGTFVRIEARGDAETLDASIDAAFAAIETVEQAASFHRPDSELHRLHAAPVGGALRIGDPLREVLCFARSLWHESRGLFDPTLAPQLVAQGVLPVPADLQPADPDANFGDVEIGADGTVRLHRRLWMDLGGIAKGYAVDLALARLRERGVSVGSVNAGGDLACFGESQRIGLRDPRAPARLCAHLDLSDAALATSGSYFTAGVLRGARGAPVRRRHGSVSVVAPRCVLADGLTKVAWAAPRRAAPILARFGARALSVDARGHARWLA